MLWTYGQHAKPRHLNEGYLSGFFAATTGLTFFGARVLFVPRFGIRAFTPLSDLRTDRLPPLWITLMRTAKAGFRLTAILRNELISRDSH
jgi:hypothetical protein